MTECVLSVRSSNGVSLDANFPSNRQRVYSWAKITTIISSVKNEAFVNEENVMNRTLIAAALAAGVMFGYSGRVWTQTDQKLPVAGYAPAKDIPGARELPNPEVDYKVVFSVAAVAKPEEIHTTLKTIALYLNTLAHHGVPAGHRHIAAVFHQGGGDAEIGRAHV